MSLFDVYLCIDWSGRSFPSPAKPAPDAVWVGERTTDGSGDETYFRTRNACIRTLHHRLRHHAGAGRRVLVGFDFPFGFPEGLCEALELEGAEPPWLRFWREVDRRISDDAHNGNNRFEVAGELNELCRPDSPELPAGPFWGCPHGRTVPGLTPRSPGFPYAARGGTSLARLRVVDRRCRGIQEGWKLYGTGSVGSQALLGLPRLLRLREDPELRSLSRIWPFETLRDAHAFAKHRPGIVYAEVWPSLRTASLDPAVTPRDRAQVRAVVTWMAEQDAHGKLLGWLQLSAGLSPTEQAAVVEEEGWILGME